MNISRIRILMVVSVLFVVGLITSCQKQPKVLHFKGQLLDSTYQSFTLKYQGLLGVVDRSRDIKISCNGNGFFDTTLTIPSPAYYELVPQGEVEVYGNYLYLSPGEDLNVSANLSEWSKSEFSGQAADVNSYLATFNLVFCGQDGCSVPPPTGCKSLKDSIEGAIRIDSAIAQHGIKRLEIIKGASPSFIAMEKGRIYSLLAYNYMFYYIYPGWQRYSDKKLLEADQNYLKTRMKSLLEGLTPMVLNDVCVEHPYTRELMRNMVVEYGSMTVSPTTPNTYEFLALSYYNFNMEKDGGDQQMFSNALEAVKTFKNKDIANKLIQTVQDYRKLAKGSPAIDIDLEDFSGKPLKLSDFKGKVICLDMWATWCFPCLNEAPLFNKLAQKYAGQNITFISVSVDRNEDKDKWRKHIAKEKPIAIQLILANSKGDKEWQVVSIPRFIVIDKHFQIVNAKASKPSMGDALEKDLQEALKL